MSLSDPFSFLTISVPEGDRSFLVRLAKGPPSVVVRSGMVRVTLPASSEESSPSLLLSFHPAGGQGGMPYWVARSLILRLDGGTTFYSEHTLTAEQAYMGLLNKMATVVNRVSATHAALLALSVSDVQRQEENAPSVKTESSPRAHVYEGHADHEPDSAECRMICDGGLSCCMVCRGAEGALPTECPGVPMTRQESEAVYAGTLDYRGGAWVGLPTPKTAPDSNDA